MIVMRRWRDHHRQNHDINKDMALPPWQGRKVSIEESHSEFGVLVG
jgi:hypothetical protein